MSTPENPMKNFQVKVTPKNITIKLPNPGAKSTSELVGAVMEMVISAEMDLAAGERKAAAEGDEQHKGTTAGGLKIPKNMDVVDECHRRRLEAINGPFKQFVSTVMKGDELAVLYFYLMGVEMVISPVGELMSKITQAHDPRRIFQEMMGELNDIPPHLVMQSLAADRKVTEAEAGKHGFKVSPMGGVSAAQAAAMQEDLNHEHSHAHGEACTHDHEDLSVGSVHEE